VNSLRKRGFVPANIYGPGLKSIAISIPMKDFMNAYKIAKETGIIYIQIEKETIPTLIKHIQTHPLLNTALHVDFRKIDLKQKIETSVPVNVIGESEAVAQKGGVLLTQHDHLIIEALPQDIPQQIDIDITTLKEVGDEFKVSNLPVSAVYTIKTEP